MDGLTLEQKPCEETRCRILIMEKDPNLTCRLDRLFSRCNKQIERESRPASIVERLAAEEFDLLIVTSEALNSTGVPSVEFLDQVFAAWSTTQVLLLVTPRDLDMVRSRLKDHAPPCAQVPVSDAELRSLIEKTLNRRAHVDGVPETPEHLDGLIGRSEVMQRVYRQIRQVAGTEIPVLLLGETGSGKELATRAIHRLSKRREGPYIPVNLGALPSELVASELFGHERGAFTGAHERRVGKFELAERGTILLDEIDSIDTKVQVSLLRLLEHHEFYRLGGREPYRSDVRLVTATNRDLATSVEERTFREDLYYRLDIFPIAMPPLRERKEDIPLLAGAFLRRFSGELGKRIENVSPGCLGLLESYAWPGNVRELKNVIQRAVLLCEGDELVPESLPERVQRGPLPAQRVPFSFEKPLHELEREAIVHALSTTQNNRKKAAQLLGITRRSLYGKLTKYKIGDLVEEAVAGGGAS
jgi:DNA-binding NtrC family response regulator